MARRPLVFVAMTLVTTIAFVVALGLLGARLLVPAALGRAFIANPIVVFATPGAARGDTDALGARLRALPIVAEVTLRPKEEALVALIQAGIPQTGDGRNPLPDAWILRLRPESGPHASFVTTATALRDTLAALPGVDQVRFDARWNERLEAWSDRWTHDALPILVAGIALVAVTLACAWFVARDAILRPLEVPSPSKERVLTRYVLATLIAAALIALLIAWAVGSLAVQGDGSTLVGSVEERPGMLLGSAFATWLTAALIAIGASRVASGG